MKPHPKRVDIATERLLVAKMRILSGETWQEVAESFGVGPSALRGAFDRAGIEVVVDRNGRRMKIHTKNIDKRGPWDAGLAAKMLSVSLRANT